MGISEFYTFLSRERLPRLLAATARIIAMLRSTLCVKIFSSIKVKKSVLMPRLTDEHL